MTLIKKVKIVFLGTKPIGYKCLQALIAAQSSLPLEVIAVVTKQRKEFGLGEDLAALAKSHNIPVLDSHTDIPDCDILYSVQYHSILPQSVIDKAAVIALNLHMAPLPEYRGCNQFSMAIIDGKNEFGTTIHQMDARIDHGDILFQKRFAVPKGCWVTQLYELTEKASYELFENTLPAIIAGEYTLIPQKSLEEEYGTSLHYRNEISGLKEIDLSWDTEKILRHIRATSMPGFEPPFTVVGNEKIYFTTNFPSE